MYIYARFHIFSFTNTIYMYKSKRLQYVQVGDFLKNPNAKIWKEKIIDAFKVHRVYIVSHTRTDFIASFN